MILMKIYVYLERNGVISLNICGILRKGKVQALIKLEQSW